MRKLRLRDNITSKCYDVKIAALHCWILNPVLFSLAVSQVWHDFREHKGTGLNDIDLLYSSVKILLFFKEEVFGARI